MARDYLLNRIKKLGFTITSYKRTDKESEIVFYRVFKNEKEDYFGSLGIISKKILGYGKTKI